MKLRSGLPYWIAIDHLAAAESVDRGLADDTDCEVVVLGGGVSGALVAWQLVRRGLDVVLVDRGDFGRGSTAASTGLLQYEVDTPLVDLIQQVGQEHAVRAYRLGVEVIDEIEALVEQLGDPCGFSRRESLYFASSVWQWRSLQQEYACRREFGCDVDWLTREELASVSSLSAAGAIRSRGDAQINPYRFTRKLIQAAQAQGLRAFAYTRVLQATEHTDEVRIQTASGVIRAKQIVYAAGYATRPFLQGEESGQLHSTYALASQPRAAFRGWPNQCLIWETARPYFYARQTDDGRAIIGGEDTAYSTDHERDGLVERKIEKLVRRFAELFPEADFVPDYAWAGTFAETKDGLAYIGQPPDRPRAYFALGYGGNGITYSMIASRLLADLITGRPNPDAEIFRFGR